MSGRRHHDAAASAYRRDFASARLAMTVGRWALFLLSAVFVLGPWLLAIYLVARF